MKRVILCTLALCAVGLRADTIAVEQAQLLRTFELGEPYRTDSLDMKRKAFDADEFMNMNKPSRFEPDKASTTVKRGDALSGSEGGTLRVFSFPLQNSRFVKAKLKADGLKKYKAYLGEDEIKGELKLAPGIREVRIVALSPKTSADTFRVQIEGDDLKGLSVSADAPHFYSMEDMMYDPRSMIADDFIDDGEIPEKEEAYPVDISRPMKQKAMNMNALRLGKWMMSIDGSERKEVDAVALYEASEEAGISLPSVGTYAFGCPKVMAMKECAVDYEFSFMVDNGALSDDIFLMMEPGSIEGKDIVIRVNGNEVSDFTPVSSFLPESLSLKITGLIKEGMNSVAVSLVTDKTYGGLRNPLYIAGDFGVFRKDGVWTLTSLPDEGSPLDRISSGLPFYSGDVSYEFEIPENAKAIEIANEEFEDSASLSADGVDSGAVAWSPYIFPLPHTHGRKAVLTVTNTLLSLFEGEVYDRKSDRNVSIE